MLVVFWIQNTFPPVSRSVAASRLTFGTVPIAVWTGLEVYEALLAPAGIRGLVIDCEDCREPHFFDWALLRANLRHLLDSGRPRVHEPAYDPDPDNYVTWEYARGYADGVHDTLTEGTEE